MEINEQQQVSDKAIIQAGWDDAPWLLDKDKDRMLAATPPHLREARSTGVPGLGAGSVYPIPLSSVVVDDFVILPHFKRLYALDVGWNKTACLFGALNPDDDVLYLYSEYYQGHEEPFRHAEAIKRRMRNAGYEFYGLIDPASRGRSQTDGKRLIDEYRRVNGLKVVEADNAVEGGIYAVFERLSLGKLKIFASLKNLQNEYTLYHRDLNGKIVKQNDHLVDCMRYLVMGLKYAKARPVKPKGDDSGYGAGRTYTY